MFLDLQEYMSSSPFSKDLNRVIYVSDNYSHFKSKRDTGGRARTSSFMSPEMLENV